MLEEIDVFNKEWEGDGLLLIKILIGVYFGLVIFGDIGLVCWLEFVVVGDIVNVVSCLEVVSRELGCNCVVSEDLMWYVNLKEDVGGIEDVLFFVCEVIKLCG